MQAAGKRTLCLAASLFGRRSAMKLVRPPAGLPGVLLNSLHQDTPSPLTGPARSASYNPGGQTGLTPADIGLLVGGGAIIGLGLYETYKSLCTAQRAPVAPDMGETVVAPKQEQQTAADRGLNLLSTTLAEPSPAGVWHRAATEPALLENVSKPVAKAATGGFKSDDPAAPTDEVSASATDEVPAPATEVPASATEVPASATEVPTSATEVPTSATEVPASTTDHHLVEKEKKPRRSARGKGGILYSSIDELESENMSASVQQFDLVVEKQDPLHTADRHTAIMDGNNTEEHKSTPMASDLSASAPSADTRGHVSQEAEDEGDGVFQGCAYSLVYGDSGKKTKVIHDGSGDRAGVEDQGRHKSPPQYNSRAEYSNGSCCRHHTEEATSAKAKRKPRYAVAKMEDNDIHTTHAGKWEDHESDCECDLAGSTVPSPVSMMGQGKGNKMAASHVVIILS